MNNLTQGNEPNLFNKGIKVFAGVTIFSAISLGMASGVNHVNERNEKMWDSQLSRMEAYARWYEDRGNLGSANVLRERIEDCVYLKERCPHDDEFESITALTLSNDDGTTEEYVAYH